MMATVSTTMEKMKTVADPCAQYESLKAVWAKCKAVCDGQQMVKDLDGIVDMSNLLIPFSPTMSQAQYEFYKAEAELPGITSQFARMIVGGLLRKLPVLGLPESAGEEPTNWIQNEMGRDGGSLAAFLDAALWEEIRTSGCWVYVDHPKVTTDDATIRADLSEIKPVAVIFQRESVINWKVSKDEKGNEVLTQLIVNGTTEEFTTNEFHPTSVNTVWVHDIFEEKYRVRVYKEKTETSSVKINNGRKQVETSGRTFELTFTSGDTLYNGKPLDFIPAWPLNGNIEPATPILSTIIDKEISLYNKVSRRNHLLYGAATYTPIIFSDMAQERFEAIVASGLGTWVLLDKDDRAEILATPTEALADMDRAIASNIEEMAKLGVRMLTPETEQSGVALQLRNAAQTAQLGNLNLAVTTTMRQVLAFMLGWRYNIKITPHDIELTLSPDLNNTPLGVDWLTLATDWYENGLIPRSAWLQLLKQNDILGAEYDDDAAKEEINGDMATMPKATEEVEEV
jgi:hypothetical protein